MPAAGGLAEIHAARWIPGSVLRALGCSCRLAAQGPTAYVPRQCHGVLSLARATKGISLQFVRIEEATSRGKAAGESRSPRVSRLCVSIAAGGPLLEPEPSAESLQRALRYAE